MNTPISDEYTPTTGQVRAAFSLYTSAGNSDWEANLAAGFDRWLAARDANTRRQALEEAAQEAHDAMDGIEADERIRALLDGRRG